MLLRQRGEPIELDLLVERVAPHVDPPKAVFIAKRSIDHSRRSAGSAKVADYPPIQQLVRGGTRCAVMQVLMNSKRSGVVKIDGKRVELTRKGEKWAQIWGCQE